MPLYVTVSEGPRPDRARPVLAISDQRVIVELLRAIGRWGESCAAVAEEQSGSASARHALRPEPTFPLVATAPVRPSGRGA